MTSCIHFGRGCVDQRTIDVKSPKGANLIDSKTRLDTFQRTFGHEERSFHRAIVSPELHGAACGVVAAATVWEAQGHRVALLFRSRQVARMLHTQPQNPPEKCFQACHHTSDRKS